MQNMQNYARLWNILQFGLYYVPFNKDTYTRFQSVVKLKYH